MSLPEDPKEPDADDPRLDAEAAALVARGDYFPVEDGRGGLFLRPALVKNPAGWPVPKVPS